MMIGLYTWIDEGVERLDVFVNGVRTTGGWDRTVKSVTDKVVNDHFHLGYRTPYAVPSEFETAVMITPKEYL